MTGADKEAQAIAGETHEERSSAMQVLAAEVQVIKADNPKATKKQIADRLGLEGRDSVKRVDAILKSNETKDIKERLEARAVLVTESLMDLLVARAQTLDDPEQLKAIKMIIDMWDKRQGEKTINVMIDNRSVSIPYNKRDWGVKNGEPYHIPTWQKAVQSDDMALVCRNEGCAMVREGEMIGDSLFKGEEDGE